jgi:hypothetical protein
MRRYFLLGASHLSAVAIGVALGIYLLPILTAPSAPSTKDIASVSAEKHFSGEFRRNLKDSDFLHWGEGKLRVGAKSIALEGRLAPGPDYKLYLSPEFVETEADFMRLKASMRRVGDIRTFENFLVQVPDGIDVAQFNTVIVWCESFSQFISAAKYR